MGPCPLLSHKGGGGSWDTPCSLVRGGVYLPPFPLRINFWGSEANPEHFRELLFLFFLISWRRFSRLSLFFSHLAFTSDTFLQFIMWLKLVHRIIPFTSIGKCHAVILLSMVPSPPTHNGGESLTVLKFWFLQQWNMHTLFTILLCSLKHFVPCTWEWWKRSDKLWSHPSTGFDSK